MTISKVGDIAVSIELLGGEAPFSGIVADAPNDFGGFLDIGDTADPQVLNLTLNQAGVDALPLAFPLIGQVIISGANFRSLVTPPFPAQYGQAAITPTVGSFLDNASFGTVVVTLNVLNFDRIVTWEILSGFDNGTGSKLLTMNSDGSMTLNSAGVTYYGANPGNGTLSGIVLATNGDGATVSAEIDLTVVAHPAAPSVASISMVHSVA